MRQSGNDVSDGKVRQQYERPTCKKLMPEEAQVILVAHASRGCKGARELLELIRPQEAIPAHPGKSA